MTGPGSIDVLIVGGGFYGCALALHLRNRGFKRILIVEREEDLLRRASFANQARIHSGYHYPRSFVTASRSRVNFPRFCHDYSFAVYSDFTMLYAIARQRSMVTPQQYERFARDIRAPLHRASREQARLFQSSLISQVYVAEEYAFDAAKLRVHFHRELAQANIKVLLKTEVACIESRTRSVAVTLIGARGRKEVMAPLILNCTYSALNKLVGSRTDHLWLKHEVAEIALIEPPPELNGLGVTVMDGPFFSTMPFPASKCHSLSHVRYTPHGYQFDQKARKTIFPLTAPRSRVHFMIADAARYLPCMARSRHLESLYEVKTVLVRNEGDDGRPILMRPESAHTGVISILGGKIDNIYDVCERLDAHLTSHAAIGA